MDEASLTALRAWCADHQVEYSGYLAGDMTVTSTPAGPVIVGADPRIGITVELLEDSVGGFMSFAIEDVDGKPAGVLTFSATNAVLRYRALGHDVPRDILVCERIVDN